MGPDESVGFDVRWELWMSLGCWSFGVGGTG